MINVRTAMVVYMVLALTALADALSPLEHKIVGSWSWQYIEGFGRIVFTSDHKVTEGFPPDDKDGRTISDKEFEIFRSGTWRLEGRVLVTEMDNRPFLAIMKRLNPSEHPRLERKIERLKIVTIDSTKMVFDNGNSLDRVKRSVQ